MKRLLLADIGGSNARFAVLAGDELGPVRSFDVRAYPTIADSVRRFFADNEGHAAIDGAVFAVAGPVADGLCALTNSPWTVDATGLKDEFGLKTVQLLNDHEALAWSLPHLTPSEAVVVCPGMPVADAPMALIGPGTGLGMACLVPGPGCTRVVASEGGHDRTGGRACRGAAPAVRSCVGGAGAVGRRAGELVPGDGGDRRCGSAAADRGRGEPRRTRWDVRHLPASARYFLCMAGGRCRRRRPTVRCSRWSLHRRWHRPTVRRTSRCHRLPRALRSQGTTEALSGRHSGAGHRATQSGIRRSGGVRSCRGGPSRCLIRPFHRRLAGNRSAASGAAPGDSGVAHRRSSPGA